MINPLFSNLLILSILFIIFLKLYKSNLINEKFIHFGPGTNEVNTITFLNTKIDNWTKTISLYIFSFSVAILQRLSSISGNTYLDSYIKNPSQKKLPFNYFSNLIIIFTTVLLKGLLPLLNTLVYITPQFQFILPNILATLLIGIPGNLYYLKLKNRKNLI